MKKGWLIAGLLVVLLLAVIGCNPKTNVGTNATVNIKTNEIVKTNTETNETANAIQKCKFEGFYVIVVKDLATRPRSFRILPENAYKDSLSGILIFDFVMKPGETAYVYPIISPFNSYKYSYYWRLIDEGYTIMDAEDPHLLIVKTREGHKYVWGRIELCIDYHGTSLMRESFYLQIR